MYVPVIVIDIFIGTVIVVIGHIISEDLTLIYNLNTGLCHGGDYHQIIE